MKWGLVIQGPVLSFGQGPNNVISGFSGHETIETNIENFAPHVCQIVVSTWENSGLNFRDRFSNKVVLLENRLPVQRDHDNRIKQFLSTYEGAKFLALNSNATHILKIRTDQLVDPDIVLWLKDFFSVCKRWFNSEKTCQESFLVFSDILHDNPFYIGDFIFAGTNNDLMSFCKANLAFNGRNLHPSIGIDYVLKHLTINDKQFWVNFYRGVPFLWQTSNRSNKAVQDYWLDVLQTRFSVMPSEYFGKIVWRGRPMSEVLPDYRKNFQFYENWMANQEIKRDFSALKSLRYLLPSRDVLYAARYEYVRYMFAIIKYYRKRFGF